MREYAPHQEHVLTAPPARVQPHAAGCPYRLPVPQIAHGSLPATILLKPLVIIGRGYVCVCACRKNERGGGGGRFIQGLTP